jgi:uncharacterized protein (TIGR00369 family)
MCFMEREAPLGFHLYTRPSPLLDPWRPLFARPLADRMVIGLHVREAHLNSRGTVHGGLLAALADQAMGHSCATKLQMDGFVVANIWTTSLTVDFLAHARPGQWLQFDTIFSHVGKTLCQAEVSITADGEMVARGRGAFRATVERAALHASSSS